MMMNSQNIIRKLNKREGFSLTETLVTVLLLTIVLSAITSGIEAARRAYKSVRMKSDGQMLLATTITELSTEFERARKLNGNEELAVDTDGSLKEVLIGSYYSEYRGCDVTLKYIDPSTATDAEAVGIVLEAMDGKDIPLVNEKTRGLDTLYTKFGRSDGKDGNPTLKKDSTTAGTGYIEFTIQVLNRNTDGTDQAVAEQTVCVKPSLCM